MDKRQKLFLVIVAGALAFFWNRQFLSWVSLSQIQEMNDVRAIMTGAEKVPNLLLNSGRWWVGSWIQEGISAYRPLASYLYWLETWVGLQWGFFWVSWFGVFLLTANALLSGIVAWRLTKTPACVWLAVLLGVALRFYNWGRATPEYWLAWYPIHQELLMNIWLLGSIVCFDIWNETAKRNYLTGTWILFLLGVFTKEHVYIFPAFALGIVQFRRYYGGVPAKISWKTGMMQVGLLFAFIFALWIYRAAILIDPRNPQLKSVHLIRKPFLYILYPFYRHILTMQFWFPGLALLLFFWGGVLTRWRSTAAGRLFLQRAFAMPVIMCISIALIFVYCAVTYSITDAFWYLFDPKSRYLHLMELASMLLTIYMLWLLIKYRKQEPTALAFTFLVLAYVPVLTYLGWHYTVAAWFIRCAYWGLIAKLVWLDITPILTTWWSLFRFNRFDSQPLLQKS